MNTLYFVKGVPTEKQKELAKKVGAKIRNVLAYHDGDNIEECNFVMGDVPDAYNQKFELSEHQKTAKSLTSDAPKTVNKKAE